MEPKTGLAEGGEDNQVRVLFHGTARHTANGIEGGGNVVRAPTIEDCTTAEDATAIALVDVVVFREVLYTVCSLSFRWQIATTNNDNKLQRAPTICRKEQATHPRPIPPYKCIGKV